MANKDRAIPPIVFKLHQKAQKYVYPYITRRLADRDVLFLNWGYEQSPPMAVPLEPPDEPDRYSIQLYHRTATQVNLMDKRVLEVSCGHGGGASYLARALQPASCAGLDLNPAAIAFCQKRHQVAGLEFVQGSAEDLPFPDQSFDAVINVQSSVHYSRFPRFLAEVARVLCAGGHFLYADLRFREQIADWEAALAVAPMRMLSQNEINAEVLRGIVKNAQQWQHVIDRRMVRVLFGLPRDAAGVRNSPAYRYLQSGRLSYRMYDFVKA